MAKISLRSRTLLNYQASQEQIQELLAYNYNVFKINEKKQFPLPSEPHIKPWQDYANKAKDIGVAQALKIPLIQLNFPIKEGISNTPEYKAATLKGNRLFKSELIFSEPEKLTLEIYPTLAGEIPVITTGNRSDFVQLIQALTKKNEPIPIPDSMGACIISGYNNWDRVERYKQQWLANNLINAFMWPEEFQRLIPQKELYQDRFIILSPGFYSNIAPSELGLSEQEWLSISLKIRLEHECTHYFTRRFFGSMRNNLLDELIADYQGITKAIGKYRSDWFLRFMGLENFPQYRDGGRFLIYQGDPPLSLGSLKILQAILKAAAENLEAFHEQFYSQTENNFNNQQKVLIALSTLTLEELASVNAISILKEAVNLQLSQSYS